MLVPIAHHDHDMPKRSWRGAVGSVVFLGKGAIAGIGLGMAASSPAASVFQDFSVDAAIATLPWIGAALGVCLAVIIEYQNNYK